MKRVLKNADISIFSEFLATFLKFFVILINFAKCYPRANYPNRNHMGGGHGKFPAYLGFKQLQNNGQTKLL